jgi:hypothetical protein
VPEQAVIVAGLAFNAAWIIVALRTLGRERKTRRPGALVSIGWSPVPHGWSREHLASGAGVG